MSPSHGLRPVRWVHESVRKHGFSTILVDGSVPPALDGADLTVFLDGVLRLAVPEQS